MLREANARLNLTRIHSFESIVLKHYVDSLLILNFTELSFPLIDMGSGPGLPGFPLRIARPNGQIILAEPRSARAEFLERVCASLNLEKIEVYAGKIGPRWTRKVASVITRAVATIPETLDRVAHVLETGGKMLFMKGPGCDEEIAQAAASHAEFFHLSADHSYRIPGTTHDRRLLIYERLPGPARAVASLTERSCAGPMREVTSEANPTFKQVRELLTGRGIRKHRQALFSGQKIVSEVVATFSDRVLAWVTDSDGPPPPTVPGHELLWIRLASRLFQKLDVAGTRAPLLLVSVPAFVRFSERAPWPSGCTLFVPFQDPENVGSVIRSAAAFGVARIVLLREAAHPFHPKSARAAGPALFQVPMEHGPSICDLSSTDVPLLSLSSSGDDIATIAFPDTFGLVPGLEGPGLPGPLEQGRKLRIPIAPGVESLNAATAAAIALYGWSVGQGRAVR
jgi:16S rRNA (guanine527-N7)-methyltransferase